MTILAITFGIIIAVIALTSKPKQVVMKGEGESRYSK